MICCAVSVENEIRESFATFVIGDPILGEKQSAVQLAAMPYLPDSPLLTRDMTQLDKERKRGRYGSKVAKDAFLDEALKKLMEKPNKNTVECLISQLVAEKFRNYTFVLSAESHLQHLLTVMLKNDFPIDDNLIIKGTTVILLPVASLGITFISAAEFLHGSFSDLKKQFQLTEKRIFFPEMLSNKKCFGTSVDTVPDLEHFLDLSDAPEDTAEKTAFWNEIQGKPFHLEECLESACRSELQIHVKSCISLLRTSFQFQLDCYSVFGKPHLLMAKHAPLLHLFAFVSVGSFTHDCWRLFSHSKEKIPLHAVMAPKKDNVSKGELEYVSYLNHCHPRQFITAFSSDRGQRRITAPNERTVIPDAYGIGSQEGVLHFFNGCW